MPCDGWNETPRAKTRRRKEIVFLAFFATWREVFPKLEESQKSKVTAVVLTEEEWSHDPRRAQELPRI